MAEANNVEETAEDQAKKSDFSRYMLYGAGAVALLVFLIFLGGVGLAVFTDARETAPRINVIRDTLIIIMALEGIVIIVALVVLVLQITRLTVTLQNESRPILRDAQETAAIAKGTAQFVGQNMVKPAVDFTVLVTTVIAFLREIGGIRRAIRPKPVQSGEKK